MGSLVACVGKGAGEGTGWAEGPVPRTRTSCGHTWEVVPPSQEGSEASPGRRSQKAEGTNGQNLGSNTTFGRTQPTFLDPCLHFGKQHNHPWAIGLMCDGMPRPGAMPDGNTSHERGGEPKGSWGQWWAWEYPDIPHARPQNSSRWQCKPGFIGLLVHSSSSCSGNQNQGPANPGR